MAKGMATDELIGMVAQKAGISQDQAKKAVDTVWDFLDDKLPEPLAGQIDKVLAIDPHNVVALAEQKTFRLDKPTTGRSVQE